MDYLKILFEQNQREIKKLMVEIRFDYLISLGKTLVAEGILRDNTSLFKLLDKFNGESITYVQPYYFENVVFMERDDYTKSHLHKLSVPYKIYFDTFVVLDNLKKSVFEKRNCSFEFHKLSVMFIFAIYLLVPELFSHRDMCSFIYAVKNKFFI